MAFAPKKPYLAGWRFELKYRITPEQYLMVKNALVPHMHPDLYTTRAPGERYLVRSLYYDTSTYQAYHEKVAGNYGRVKMRIRSYSDRPDTGAPLRVELKVRRGPVMEKHRCSVTASDCDYFLAERHWPVLDNPVLIEFERMVHLRAQSPKVLVEYRREGLQARARDDLRITFDHGVHSAAASCLFPEHPFFRDHHRHMVIMEIKCRFDQPAWLIAIVKKHGLRLVANSKYTRAIEVASPDVVTPAWGYLDPTPVPQLAAIQSLLRLLSPTPSEGRRQLPM